MAEGIHHYFDGLVARHEGILAILVTDRDGVPLVKVGHHVLIIGEAIGAEVKVLKSQTHTYKLVSDPKVPQNALRASFLSTFSTTAEQASKLGLSKNKSIVCFFASYQVVHFSFPPLVVSIIATSQANTGLLLGLESDFEQTIRAVKSVVDGV